MLRNILAIIVGWLVGMIVWGVLFAALFVVGRQVAPEQFPWPPPEKMLTPGTVFLVVSLLIDAAMGFTAGYVIAWIARKPATIVVGVASVLMIVGLVATAVGERELLPPWVSWSRVIIAPAALWAGAKLRGRNPSGPQPYDMRAKQMAC